MVPLIDGHPPAVGPDRRIHRMIYTRDVIAMEVHREHARQDVCPCGVLLYWTRVGWERFGHG